MCTWFSSAQKVGNFKINAIFETKYRTGMFAIFWIYPNLGNFFYLKLSEKSHGELWFEIFENFAESKHNVKVHWFDKKKPQCTKCIIFYIYLLK